EQKHTYSSSDESRLALARLLLYGKRRAKKLPQPRIAEIAASNRLLFDRAICTSPASANGPMNLGVAFRPKLLETLKGYNRRDFIADLIAGLTVGIVALPLAMAFAIASGVKPEAGIFTAVIAGFIISALGGTRIR